MFTGHRPQWVSPASVAPPAEPWAPTEGDGRVDSARKNGWRMLWLWNIYWICMGYSWDIYPWDMEIMLWLWNMYGIFMVYLSPIDGIVNFWVNWWSSSMENHRYLSNNSWDVSQVWRTLLFWPVRCEAMVIVGGRHNLRYPFRWVVCILIYLGKWFLWS